MALNLVYRVGFVLILSLMFTELEPPFHNGYTQVSIMASRPRNNERLTVPKCKLPMHFLLIAVIF